MDVSSTDEFVPEKNEVMIFEVQLQSIVKEISSGVSLETFTQLFGDVVKNRSSLLKKLHSVFVRELYDGIMNEIQLKEFVEEENLEEKFSKRTKLIKEHSLEEGAVAWRPTTGDVAQQVRSHDMDALLKYKRELEESVLSREASVDHLQMKLSSLRLKMHKLESDIAASKQSKAERIGCARRLRDGGLSAWLENSKNTKKQSQLEQSQLEQ